MQGLGFGRAMCGIEGEARFGKRATIRREARRPLGVTTRKCSECPVRMNNARTHPASNEGFSRNGLSRPGAGCASSVQM
jgi:hypothetical protein